VVQQQPHRFPGVVGRRGLFWRPGAATPSPRPAHPPAPAHWRQTTGWARSPRCCSSARRIKSAASIGSGPPEGRPLIRNVTESRASATVSGEEGPEPFVLPG